VWEVKLETFRLDMFDDMLSIRMDSVEWQRILAFRKQPGMFNGLFAYAEIMPEFFADNLILNKVVTEEWRFYTLVFTLHLNDTRNPDDPLSGLTLSNLQRVCREQKVASFGRVAAILGIMQLGGYVHRRPSTSDGRVRHLEPTPGFMAVVEEWTQRLLRIIDAICPEDNLAAHHRANPGFGRQMRRRGAEVMLGGWRAVPPFPEVAHFLHSDGGWMLLLPLIAQSIKTGNGGLAPVSFDLAAHGRRFGVSRSHLRRMLEGAWQKGLLAEPPRNGAHIVPTAKLAASFLTCMASELGYARAWALETRDALGLRAA
jgi:hypothetical protein